ncbi:hypothetical protein [Deinococcus peraridilitoris]|uniref:Uncharacterized protein n=1 Tax=Deinococcus peraridilitoris (strain DSM 19664 / LMG 22246 / CIP 109416 / KR-200) TaxID=937777 RepID=L0A1A7_DEIPD|nr:hypothetical protein [Deinococcus peraridilitoris]AFZ66967.1 hypothetical protein Deipe_1426 [Deinococcus peraridilitoris DSM 19664]
MKTYAIRRLTHRDIQRQYFAVTENGIDIAFTDSPEKAQRLMLALHSLAEGNMALRVAKPA